MYKKIQRWNPSTHEYEPYEIPSDRNIVALAFDMDAIVDCASCGVSLPAGDTYTSHEIHTPSGFGYLICPKCYEEERTRYLNEH